MERSWKPFRYLKLKKPMIKNFGNTPPIKMNKMKKTIKKEKDENN